MFFVGGQKQSEKKKERKGTSEEFSSFLWKRAGIKKRLCFLLLFYSWVTERMEVGKKEAARLNEQGSVCIDGGIECASACYAMRVCCADIGVQVRACV